MVLIMVNDGQYIYIWLMMVNIYGQSWSIYMVSDGIYIYMVSDGQYIWLMMVNIYIYGQ